MTNGQTIDSIMGQADDYARAWADAQGSEAGYRGTAHAYRAEEKASLRHAITAALAAKDAEIERASAARDMWAAEHERQIDVARDLRDEIERLKARLTDSGCDLQALKPEPGEWIEWKGGPPPIQDGVRFQVRVRVGDDMKPSDFASAFSWAHLGMKSDIVAYRVLP